MSLVTRVESRACGASRRIERLVRARARADDDARAPGHRTRTWELTYISTTRARVSKRQKQNLRELYDAHGVRFDASFGRSGRERVHALGALDWDEAFGSAARSDGGERRTRVLELGCGMGDNLVRSASERRESHVFLGVDVHRPGIATCLGAIRDAGLTNARCGEIDGLWLLRDFALERSIDECLVHFPDPWRDDTGRERKAHRRLVNPTLLKLLERALVPETGRLSVATDDDQYARHIERVFEEFAQPRGWVRDVPFPRFQSKYSTRASEQGRSCVDVAFRWTGTPPNARDA